MNSTEILKKLISYPTYVDSKNNESALADWIYDYLTTCAFSRVFKQPLMDGRFNVIALTSESPELMVAGHMDTVEPKQGWAYDQFSARVVGDKLYGLGAYDTKGGLAALLAAAPKIAQQSNIMLVFYCDEEYDFLGMKTLLADLNQSRPKSAIVIEPTALSIWNAHRGIIELSFTVRGKTGHAARLQNGVNAIECAYDSIKVLREWLGSLDSQELGVSTINLAYLHGGLYLGSSQDENVLGRQGNNIPDYAEAVLDIRTTNPEINANGCLEVIKTALDSAGAKLDSSSVRHDLRCLSTPKESLALIERAIEKVVPVAYLDGRSRGYGDGQMIREEWNIPVCYLGPDGGNAHAVDEWVSLESVRKLQGIFESLG